MNGRTQSRHTFCRFTLPVTSLLKLCYSPRPPRYSIPCDLSFIVVVFTDLTRETQSVIRIVPVRFDRMSTHSVSGTNGCCLKLGRVGFPYISTEDFLEILPVLKLILRCVGSYCECIRLTILILIWWLGGVPSVVEIGPCSWDLSWSLGPSFQGTPGIDDDRDLRPTEGWMSVLPREEPEGRRSDV